jgi:hypothetical protein
MQVQCSTPLLPGEHQQQSAGLHHAECRHRLMLPGNQHQQSHSRLNITRHGLYLSSTAAEQQGVASTAHQQGIQGWPLSSSKAAAQQCTQASMQM